MKDAAKTIVLLVLAAASLLVAWAARPAAPGPREFDDSGQPFFASFDPLSAASLEITKPDAAGQPQTFMVALRNGVWSIPSHEGYPADSQTQLSDAASSVMSLSRGPAVTDRPSDHEIFGVVDPRNAPPGATGIGTRVTLRDAADALLVDLIIGLTPKDQPSLRYVRLPSADRVYTTKVPADKFSTSFSDWIERDLLMLDPMQIAKVIVKDYTIDEFNSRVIQVGTLDLDYDSRGRTWTLADLAAGEELDTAKLDALKSALDDLKIVNVLRKPAGLSAELRTADQIQLDNAAVNSLRSHGYYIAQGQLLSNEGETVVVLNTGVQYVLRFGEIVMTGLPTEFGDAASTSPATSDESSEVGRYLFITAEFNEKAIPEPAYRPIPDFNAIQKTDADSASKDIPQEELDAMLVEAKKKIEDENAKLKADHEKAIEDGKARVTELNARFADWYYVISDPVYSKIRLSRETILKQQAAPPTSIPEPPPLSVPEG